MEPTRADETAREVSENLTCEQRELAGRHLWLVGLHLRNRVPTPRRPTRDRDYDDLFQEGCVALLRAAGRFRPGSDGPFAAYALPRIRGAVHAAVFEQFGTIRVPVKARRAGSGRYDPSREEVKALPKNLITHDPPRPGCPHTPDTIGHLLRARFVRAVRTAVREMRDGGVRGPHRRTAVERVAAERILVSREEFRTSLRVIANDCGLSSGRICNYEHRLLDRARRLMRDDPQVPLLVHYARTLPGGRDARLDGRRLARLQQADERAFRNRFDALPPLERADLLYRLIAASTPRISDIAVNLHRLAGDRL